MKTPGVSSLSGVDLTLHCSYIQKEREREESFLIHPLLPDHAPFLSQLHGRCSFEGLGCCSCRVCLCVCVGVGGVVLCRCLCV